MGSRPKGRSKLGWPAEGVSLSVWLLFFKITKIGFGYTWSKIVWFGQMKLHLSISSWPSG